MREDLGIDEEKERPPLCGYGISRFVVSFPPLFSPSLLSFPNRTFCSFFSLGRSFDSEGRGLFLFSFLTPFFDSVTLRRSPGTSQAFFVNNCLQGIVGFFLSSCYPHGRLSPSRSFLFSVAPLFFLVAKFSVLFLLSLSNLFTFFPGSSAWYTCAGRK